MRLSDTSCAQAVHQAPYPSIVNMTVLDRRLYAVNLQPTSIHKHRVGVSLCLLQCCRPRCTHCLLRCFVCQHMSPMTRGALATFGYVSGSLCICVKYTSYLSDLECKALQRRTCIRSHCLTQLGQIARIWNERSFELQRFRG